MNWVDQTAARLAEGVLSRELYLAISLVSRKTGKDDLRLAEDDLRTAQSARLGWNPLGWSVDQAARILFLVRARGEPGAHGQWLDQLCVTADVGELIALYRGLPLYPDQESHLHRAMEGARTNMKAVFEAVAHRNPYPAERFPENVWNHMVLKAIFIGSTLRPIHDLDGRINPRLMRMLCDYAHERWAAGREVAPELWRCVGPCADEAALDDLERVLASDSAAERAAAALALAACPAPRAKALLASHSELANAIEIGTLDWQTLPI